ncbi:MAG TPA: hypothetical protein VER36_04500, partial [Flavisolibacter sp.]|nr:hypothetical protein [Flavisolibacter sp.]
DGLYDLTIGDLQLDVLASTVALKDVTVAANEQILNELKNRGTLPANVFHLSVESFVIEGINLDDALTRKTMDYKLVKLVNPAIHVYRQKKQKTDDENKEGFSQRFLKEMTKLAIGQLVITGGSIVSHSNKNKTKKLSDVEVAMNNILLDSTTRNDKKRFLFARDATINFRNYSTQTTDGLYTLRIASGSIASPQKQVILEGLSFASPFSREQFIKRQKAAKELFDFSLASATLTNLDWWSLFNEEELVADALTASKGKLTIYSDRSLPPRSRKGNFPNQLLATLPLKLDLKKLKVRNLDFAYTEHNPVTKQNGTIYFDNIALNGSNLSTLNSNPFTINGSAQLMHSVPVKAAITFDMKSPMTGGFSAAVSTQKPFEGSVLNPFSMPMGMLRIERGTIQKLQADIKGDQLKAGGNVTALYKDLKIALLEKDDSKMLDKKDVTSFLANLLVVKNDNPKNGKEVRSETAVFNRDPDGGFFMLLWKTMLVGMLKTIGAPEKLAYKKQQASKR